MSKRTNKFGLTYFEAGDLTSSLLEAEIQRFETLDVQLHALFEILGNGIISGWNLVAGTGLSIVITPGSGHVAFVAVESISNETILNLTPNSRNYIYAILTQNSYWTKEVDFASFGTEDPNTKNVYLGYVDTTDTSIESINVENRKTLGYLSLIQNLISSHRHIGGATNPPPIDLSSEVQGALNQDNLPDLDASIITTGILDEERFPTLDHITKLINKGTLTHAQLDSFADVLSISNNPLMGETSTVNLLQLILALKHIHPNIDQYLVNTISYIPGISSSSYVDSVNTTANVNTVGMVIEGINTSSSQLYVNIWSTKDHFNQGQISNVLIDGDQVSLGVEENILSLDDFNNISGWSIVTSDLSNIPNNFVLDSSVYTNLNNSGKVTVGDQEVEIALELIKNFDAQDWSNYKFIVFFLKTTSVQHGDIIFYLNDVNAGSQNSHTVVLNRNTPTINIDTLQNGWQEVRIDISSYTRSAVNTIGLYVSSQYGWDTSKDFDFNIDQIYLTTGNVYKSNGYIRLIFGSSLFYNFWRARWDALVPSDADSLGIEFKVRYRVSNDNITYSNWSTYSSSSPYLLNPDSLYKYIELEVYFGASTSLTRTAFLKKLYLDFYAADVENSFTFNTTDDWLGGTLFNINTVGVSNSISIGNTDEIGQFQYASNGEILQVNNSYDEIYTIYGTALPKTTYQSLNNISPSFGLITGLSRGNNGNIWVSDIDNDRIVEIDKSGNLITAFYGSFLNEPYDPYGTEDSGPGSNVDVLEFTETVNTFSQLDVLHSFYNPNNGILTVVFNINLENIYLNTSKFNINGFFLKIGSQRVNLSDSNITLFSVDKERYNNWYEASLSGSSENTQFLNQFTFKSHVLQIELKGPDKTYVNYMVNQEAPSIVAYTPYQYERKKTSSVIVKFLLSNYVLGSGPGENSIELKLDSDSEIEIYDTQKEFTGLSDGLHTVTFKLKENGSTLLTNIEATGSISFIVDTSSVFSNPRIGIKTPKENQIYSSSPVTVEFEVENFPVLPTGQHIKYTLDSEASIDYYSTDPIILSDLSSGEHSIKLELVDENGELFNYSYGTVISNFNVGLNSNAIVKLYVNKNSIFSENGIGNVFSVNDVNIGNIYTCNIYCPIDVQVISDEVSKLTNGSTTILVAKMRSPSTTLNLSTGDKVIEFINRLASSTDENVELNSSLSDIPTSELIYDSKYLDGHSVIQYDIYGKVLMSNNAAKFASTKSQAIDILGSCEKIGDNELLIADSLNKRAIITYTNLFTEETQISWQYDSDRYISDFHIVSNSFSEISIDDATVSPSLIYIRQGSTIVWKNDSSIPVNVYSGTTSATQFSLDDDLNLYGDIFKSSELQVGERYSFKFNTVGEYNWFVYPGILTGQINVTKNRLSSNDKFLILENDGLESPYSSRVIKVDVWGNILWSFGESMLVKPRDARPLLNGGVIIST